ncbi:uncharacterized protein [Montipora capricornis]|uniref:uncharacterized protein n=1 Tax=Montipora capricornis TaxID=246305 RepID=UPI0035F1EEDF
MEISKQVFWCALYGGIGGIIFTALLFKILQTSGRRQERDDGENRDETTRRPENSARFRQCTKLPQEQDERNEATRRPHNCARFRWCTELSQEHDERDGDISRISETQ